MKRKIITKEDLLIGIEKAGSMLAASTLIGIPYTTFIRHAKKYGIYEPNQGRIGQKKPWLKAQRKKLEDLLLPDIVLGSSQLKRRLLDEGYLEEICSDCCIGPEWNRKRLVLQLDHVDGNARNNTLENLRLLCPNCHSQTDTFCRGQGKNYK